ncbi:ABATE domain-containing protein [Saccharomonospora sp. NPDC006951]
MAELVALTGEPLALDFVNTVPETPDGPIDLLATRAQLRTWLDCEAGRFPELGGIDVSGVSSADMAVLHTLRGHVAAAIESARGGAVPKARALSGINAALRGAPKVGELVVREGNLRALERRQGSAASAIAARIAEAAAELLTSPGVTKIRQCDASFCVLLFLPAHPRRRWCSPTLCGNRVRVARYYQRHKAQHA